MSVTSLQVFPENGVQDEIIANGGAVALGDVTTTGTILLETKESSGDTSVASYVVFHDDATDERRCVMRNLKTVDENHTTCTTAVSMGRVDGTNTRSVEDVIQYTPSGVDIRSVSSAGSESVSTMDIEGLSFNSDSVGVIMGAAPTQFRIFYDDTTETLQIQYLDTSTSQWVTKREFSR